MTDGSLPLSQDEARTLCNAMILAERSLESMAMQGAQIQRDDPATRAYLLQLRMEQQVLRNLVARTRDAFHLTSPPDPGETSPTPSQP